MVHGGKPGVDSRDEGKHIGSNDLIHIQGKFSLVAGADLRPVYTDRIYTGSVRVPGLNRQYTQ